METRHCYYLRILKACFPDSSKCPLPSRGISQMTELPRHVNTFLTHPRTVHEASWRKMSLGHCYQTNKHGAVPLIPAAVTVLMAHLREGHSSSRSANQPVHPAKLPETRKRVLLGWMVSPCRRY